MISTSLITELNVSNILARVTEYEIFRYYLGTSFETGRTIKSPLRQDTTPSFVVYKASYGTYQLRFKDHGTGEGGSCMDLVMKLYGCTFSEALRAINADFNLRLGGLNAKPALERLPALSDEVLRQRTIIKVRTRPWNAASDKDYWGAYGLTCLTLQHYQVYPLTDISINHNQSRCYLPTYGYYFGEGLWKIYSPLSQNGFKWFSNTSSHIIQGFSQLPETGDVLVITKSLKDVMVFYQLGIPAIAPQSEGVILPEDVINGLKNRFTRLYVNFDFDYTGVKGANQYRRLYGLEALFLTNGRFNTINYGAKDVADFVRTYGVDKLNDLLDQ